MRTVSDAMALARTPLKKTAANQNKAKGGKTRKVSLGKFFKYILILSLFAGLSYMLASLVSVYMEKMKNGQSQTGDQPVATAPLPASLPLKMHRKTCQLIQHRPLNPLYPHHCRYQFNACCPARCPGCPGDGRFCAKRGKLPDGGYRTGTRTGYFYHRD